MLLNANSTVHIPRHGSQCNILEISPGDVPREGFEGVVPGRRRRNTQSEEEAWNWLTEYIVKPHSDASSGSVSDVFLPQFEDLEPFDWKGENPIPVELTKICDNCLICMT